MTPEEKARIKIDQWLTEAGWKVINREEYEPTCTAVAIREGLLKGNLEADYFLFINGKAVGVLEAKREETDAFSAKVCEQAALYAKSVPNIYQTYQKPLPLYSYVRLSIDRCTLRTSEHRSMYSYVRLSIDRLYATYV